MKKLFVLGIALFFCLFFVGCSWVTVPPFIPDNGGMDEYDSQFISLLNELDTPSKLISYLKDFLKKKETVLIMLFLVVTFYTTITTLYIL